MTVFATEDRFCMQETNAGRLIGRADLGDEVILDAVRARLASTGRNGDAERLISAAMDGDETSLAFVRTVAVPPPVARLTMPIQQLTARRIRLPSISFGRLSADRN
ncbi:hypothetical protein VQ042_05210 [Aurantimonas sp. A2-1-M11]|uniref:hypothetical protein n=1 Tax=Aurantimonas sp. A2-1-M11 TaxID=3113712 RepID=UPI002F957A22